MRVRSSTSLSSLQHTPDLWGSCLSHFAGSGAGLASGARSLMLQTGGLRPTVESERSRCGRGTDGAVFRGEDIVCAGAGWRGEIRETRDERGKGGGPGEGEVVVEKRILQAQNPKTTVQHPARAWRILRESQISWGAAAASQSAATSRQHQARRQGSAVFLSRMSFSPRVRIRLGLVFNAPARLLEPLLQIPGGPI